MRSVRGFSLYELLLVSIVVSIVVTVAAYFYASMAKDVRRFGLEIAANNFITAVSAVRAQWYLDPDGAQRDGVVVYDRLAVPPEVMDSEVGRRIYLNSYGWPVATEDSLATRTGRLQPEHCLQLWQGLLRSGVIASLEPGNLGDYRVALLENGRCRYRLEDDEPYFFDYDPSTGEVSINTPRGSRK